MRLYKLISRHGQKKKRMYPWLAAPVAGAPQRYFGWHWDPAEKEWVDDYIPEVEVEVEVPKYPRPLESPRPAQPINVPGWYWNGRAGQWEEIPLTPMELSEGIERGTKPTRPPGPAVPTEAEGWSWSEAGQEWVATIIFGQKIGFEPPRPLPPDLSPEQLEALAAADPSIRALVEILQQSWIPPILMTEYELRNMMLLLTKSGYSNVAAWDVITRYALLTKGMTAEQLAEYWKHVQVQFYYVWRRSHLISTPQGEVMWAEAVRRSFGIEIDSPLRAFVTLALIMWSAALGVALAKIFDSIFLSPVGTLVLPETAGTYLLGPDEWLYSKNIGKSLGGRTYYSHCGSIGTEYVRHKRARGKRGYDVIDFPGGFVETGFKFPYWVKYTWSHWVLQYIGMLESSGERFYRLKECDYDRFATVLAGYSVKQSEWCKDFHYYL